MCHTTMSYKQLIKVKMIGLAGPGLGRRGGHQGEKISFFAFLDQLDHLEAKKNSIC